MVDFRVTVIDDRPEFADRERFPAAEEVICQPFEGLVEKLGITSTDYIVIVTRGHLSDGVVLGEALKTPAAYIGMIGSHRKRDAIYSSLLEKGYKEEDLERVHSPIGLEIGAEMPAEIALAIVGELVNVRSSSGGKKKYRRSKRLG